MQTNRLRVSIWYSSLSLVHNSFIARDNMLFDARCNLVLCDLGSVQWFELDGTLSGFLWTIFVLLVLDCSHVKDLSEGVKEVWQLLIREGVIILTRLVLESACWQLSVMDALSTTVNQWGLQSSSSLVFHRRESRNQILCTRLCNEVILVFDVNYKVANTCYSIFILQETL